MLFPFPFSMVSLVNIVIPVFHRSAYGRTRTYPANADQALALHELTGTHTLEDRHVRALKQLGFSFQTVHDPKAPHYGSVDSLSLPSPVNSQ